MYKPGDRVKADDLNGLLQLFGDGFASPSFTTSGSEKTGKPKYNIVDDIIVTPDVNMPAFSAFMVDDLASYDANVKRPKAKVKGYGHLRNGLTTYFTNGPIPINAGQDGWAIPMVVGRYYWVQAVDNVQGVCGLQDVTDFKLRDGLPGFVAAGYATVDGMKCGMVTPYNGIIYAKHVSGAGPAATGTFYAYKSNSPKVGGGATPGVTVTTVLYTALNPGSTAITSGADCYLFPVLGMYFAVEVC
jgi:hypothetical protein